MGLFDKKRPPVSSEVVVPAALLERPEAKPVAADTIHGPRGRAGSPSADPASYGIQNAIELMRQLPNDNVALVVEVVRKTLESLDIDIGSIVEDAERKRARIDERVAIIRSEIRDYEDEIAGRKDEIRALTADRDETEMVKGRLELALQPRGGSGARPAAAASLPPAAGLALQAGPSETSDDPKV